jgi:transcriptional regulator with XRE-family HTH domain
MTDTIARLLEERMKERGLSLRKAGREIGLAHTTLVRILRGEPYDVSSGEKIADWLGVPLSTLLDTRGASEDTDTLAAKIAAVLETEPRLARVFGDAMERVLNGEMSNEAFRDLAAYAAFKLQLVEENDAKPSQQSEEDPAGD